MTAPLSATTPAGLPRAWHTVRHVPPRQLLRRAELTRPLSSRLDLVGSAASGRRRRPSAPVLPQPILPATGPTCCGSAGAAGPPPALGRAGACVARRLADPAAAETDGSTRADGNNLHFMEYLESVDDALWAELVDDWIAAQSAGRPPTLGAMPGGPTTCPCASPSGSRRSRAAVSG